MASIYWEHFPSRYIRQILEGGDGKLERIEIKHTKPLNLYAVETRNQFPSILVRLLAFVTDGRANIDHLRRDGKVIYGSPSCSVEDSERIDSLDEDNA